MTLSLPTLEAAKSSPLFKQLREKEKKFLEAYIESNGDGRKAAYAAYDCANNDSAAALARQVLSRPLIVAILTPEERTELSLEEARLLLSDIARDPKASPNVRIAAVEEIGVLKGWRARQSKADQADEERKRIVEELDNGN